MSKEQSTKHQPLLQKPTRIWLFALLNLLLLTSLSAWLWQQQQPVYLPDTSLSPQQKLQCVSYSPYYHDGQSPIDPHAFISPTQIDQDLTKLARQFNCVRIYSVGQGLDYVPKAAQALGMQVYLGAWIGWTKSQNDKELDLAIRVANQYPNTVKALIVGNEVLLRGEQSESALQAYLTKARQATQIPVTYADVWEFWRKHPALENHVDFITVHILPYWEDTPQAIANAVSHTENIMTILQHEFKKPILIGETGWPSMGRQRQASEPSLINQAQYLRGFLNLAHQQGWQYNLIEAIDQPWKRTLEGTVGGYWGIYNTQLAPKFAFTGPVQPRSDGWHPFAYAGFTSLVCLGLGLLFRVRTLPALTAIASLGALIGINTYLQIEYLTAACQNANQWLALAGVAIIGTLACMSLIAMFSRQFNLPVIFLQTALTLLLTAALTASLLLIFDGRYRDFAIRLYALPAIIFSLGLAVLGQRIRPQCRAYLILHVLSICAAAYCLYLEPANQLAWNWLGINIALVTALWPARLNLASLNVA